MKNKNKSDCNVLIIDFASIFYKYAFGLKDLINSNGKNIGAIKGMIMVITRLINQFQIISIINCLDSHSKERKERFKDYKANRKPMPDLIKNQIKPFLEIAEAININNIFCQGYEADDLIATVTKNIDSNHHCFILTGDKDLFQLQNNKNTILYFNKGIKILDTKQKIKNVIGVFPEKLTDFLSLAGDSADNIPGIRGIGKITAIKLLEQYQSVENIFLSLEEIKKKNFSVYKKIFKMKKIAIICKILVTINKNVPINTNNFISIFDKKIKEKKILRLLKILELEELYTKIKYSFDF